MISVLPRQLKYSDRFLKGICQPGSWAIALLQNCRAFFILDSPSLARATNMNRALRVVLLFSVLECRLKEPKLGS